MPMSPKLRATLAMMKDVAGEGEEIAGANWFSEMREVLKAALDANGVLPMDGGNGNQFGGMNGRFLLRGVLEFLTEFRFEKSGSRNGAELGFR